MDPDELNVLLNRFRQSRDYTQEMLIRDLIDLATALSAEIKDLKARVAALEP